jgi:hypothetical protein
MDAPLGFVGSSLSTELLRRAHADTLLGKARQALAELEA